MRWVVNCEHLKSLGFPPPPPLRPPPPQTSSIRKDLRQRAQYCLQKTTFTSEWRISLLVNSLLVLISHQSHYTNSRNNLYVPRPRLDLFKTSTSFAGASLWNSLPQNVNVLFLFPVSDIICTNICLRITFHQIWTDLFESRLPKNVSVVYIYICVSLYVHERNLI